MAGEPGATDVQVAGRAGVRGGNWMAVDGQGIVGSILRTIPRPSKAIPQVPRCFPTTSSSKRTYVTG